MTRINTIDPQALTDQHLMAEYRELPMVHAALSRSLSSLGGLDLSTISSVYLLNRGHVKFFYDKGKWLHERWNALIDELRKRGYEINPGDRVVNWNVFVDNNLYGDWQPDQAAHKINVERLVERCKAKPDWYKYYGQAVPDHIWSEYERILL